jgi:hypothetical protein
VEGVPPEKDFGVLLTADQRVPPESLFEKVKSGILSKKKAYIMAGYKSYGGFDKAFNKWLDLGVLQ